jgi:hypothetical protein
MTRKDYVAIARAIAYVGGISDSKAHHRTLNQVAEELAMELKTDNCRFDKGRFLKACKLNS